MAEGVLSGDIVWVNFPAPTEITIGSVTRTVGRLAFVARPMVSPGPLTLAECRVEFNEAAKVSFSDLNFVMAPPQVSLSLRPDGGFSFDALSPHSVILASGELGAWVAADYEVVQNADGSICHHAITAPTAQRAFFQAFSRRKGWDGTIKGR